MSRAALYTAFFFLLAPGTNAFLVPWAIAGFHRPEGELGASGALGLVLLACGFVAAVACFVRFVREGSGTPAPAAPTESLVVGGLYRFVRNPMYLAVAAMIGGWALVLHDGGILVWLLVFMGAVWTFVTAYEEPTLTQQFGDSYVSYREAVPGWWPRLTPYRG